MAKEKRELTSTNTMEMSEGDSSRTDAVNPDSALAWMAVVAAFACNVISDGFVYSFGIIQSEVVEVFQEPVAKVAWVFAIMNGISLILVALGGLLGFIGLASSSFATSVDALLVTTGVLVGLAVCLVYTTAAASGSYYCDKSRVLGTAIIMCGSGAGSFLMPPIINWLIENFALRGAYLILSALYLNCTMLSLFMFPVTSHQPKQRIRLFGHKGNKQLPNKTETECMITNKHKDSVENTHSDYCPSTWKRISETFKLSLFRSPTFIAFCIADFLAAVGVLIPLIYLPAHAVEMGIDKTAAAFLLSIEGAISTAGKIFVGYICDHFKVNLLIVNNVGCTLMGVLMLLLPFYTNYEWLTFYAVGTGIAGCLTSAGGIVLMTRLLGLENANSAYGFVLMFFGFGSLIGTPLAGWLYDEMGNYYSAFVFAGSAVLLAALVCYTLGYINRWERRRHNVLLI